MIVYKLTDADDQTYGGCQWGEGVTHTATGDGKRLCTDGYVHAYEPPLLAVLHDPIHGGYGPTAHLWECESQDEPLREGQLKLGVRSLTTLRRIELPAVTTAQRVRYAILCARAAGADAVPRWTPWADAWLDGSDRTAVSAERAMLALDRAQRASALAAVQAAWALRAAPPPADAWLDGSDQAAARASALAAPAALWDMGGNTRLDLIALAQRAMEVQP